jgi:putative peptidoglycan lipid II flippase
MGNLNERLVSAMDIIALITIPITFFSLSQGETLIRLLFQSRNFDDTSVALTLSAFTFHMPGLFFIALNRILAPAFYAQSDSKSPTLAGIISFAVNMALAALLVGPFRGAGIALALSLAGAVNTALLLIFLRRNPRINLDKALRNILAYAAKLVLFSCAAAAPVVILSPWLLPRLAPYRRVGYGILLGINALMFASVGIGLLAISRDKQLRGIVNMLTRKNNKAVKY